MSLLPLARMSDGFIRLAFPVLCMKTKRRQTKLILLAVAIVFAALLAYGWTDYQRGVSDGYNSAELKR